MPSDKQVDLHPQGGCKVTPCLKSQLKGIN